MTDPTAVPDAPDPGDVAASPEYSPPAEGDPTGHEITDPADPSYVEPAAAAVRPTAVIEPVTDGAGATYVPEG